jgi:hypothetical protein
VHETLDIILRDRDNRLPAEQRDDVPRDPATMGYQRALPCGDLPARRAPTAAAVVPYQPISAYAWVRL